MRLPILLALLFALLLPQPAHAAITCATPEQIGKIQTALESSPGALPNVLAGRLGVSEAVFVTGLNAQVAVGTDGAGFSKIWESLASWEHPALLVPLDKDNMIEVLARIGPKVSERDGQVLVTSNGPGIGGHFKPASIGSIYVVRIPNGTQTIHGTLFFNSSGETLLGVYSVVKQKPALIAILSPDAYQRTWDLVAAMPRVCLR